MTRSLLRNLPIGRKLVVATMLVTAVALVLTSAGFILFDLFTLRQSFLRSLQIQSEMMASNSASAILFDDPESAAATLASLRADPQIALAQIDRKDGRPLATYHRPDLAPSEQLPDVTKLPSDSHRFLGNRLLISRRILSETESIGTLYILADTNELYARMKGYAWIAFGILFMALVVAWWVSTRMQVIVSDPILRLAEAAKAISLRKDYSVRVPADREDELGVLGKTFNEMLEQIVADMEARNRAEAEVRELNAELEQRVEQRTAELVATNKELEAFTYSVSHDLRAPLRHIDGFSQILVQEYGPQLDSQAQHYLHRVRDGAQHMGRLVDDLLNLSRVGRGDLNLQLAGLNSIVEEALRDLKPEIDGRKIEWRIARMPFAECDARLVKQVFANLLSNALKYTRHREKTEIEIGHKSVDKETVIFVRDNGVGFNMKYADRLFGIFQRLHRQEDFEGTGVGLATVQRIIQKHGGRVWAEAELDKGATFYFTLGQ